ncbi:hypothetical protein Taro_053114 [Colocasia esculenta]|uniref:Uncharacterized protein n=1 Tax=Colocasia esculenta TaxID=4460 RepID=A0A843XKC6_COLES|nr:hypothetical protein [Colocasia esculenta]
MPRKRHDIDNHLGSDIPGKLSRGIILLASPKSRSTATAAEPRPHSPWFGIKKIYEREDGDGRPRAGVGAVANQKVVGPRERERERERDGAGIWVYLWWVSAEDELLEEIRCGIELSAWNASDSVAGVPIKKRRFLFTRSPSPPPSCPTAASADNGDTQMEEATSLAVEPSASGVATQLPDTGCTGFRDSPADSRAKDIGGRQVNLAQDCRSYPSYSEGLLSTLNVTAATELGNGGKIISENGPTARPIMGTVPETIEFRSASVDGSFGNKLILSEKSAFQRVLTNMELPLPLNRQCELSLGELSAQVGSAREGEPSSCKLELTLSESHSTSLSKEIDSGLESSHDNQHTSRSHWDLNTTMDTWESSIFETTVDDGKGGDNKVGFRSIHCKSLETEQINKNPQESTGIHVMPGKCELSENTCNLKLLNTLNPASEKSGINTNLNLQLNMAFGSMPISKVSVPFAPATPCLHKASDSSISVVRPTSTHLKLAACGDVKTEPVEDGGNGKYTGTSSFKALNHNIVKSEALDIVQQGCAKVMCPNDMETACGGAVKLEQLEVPHLGGPKKPEVKAHNCECSIDVQETVKAGGVHHGKEENAAWSLNLVSQGIVDSNKVQETLSTPSIDASCTMGGLVCKVAPVAVSVKTLVLNDTKLDLSQGAPSNSEQSHGASPTLDCCVISESVVSDANDSHNSHLTPMHVVPQDDEENIIKASEVPSETRVVVCSEVNQAKGANEVGSTSDVHLDSRNKEQRENIKQTLYSDSDMQLPTFVLMDVHDLHTSDVNKVTENSAREETEKPDLYKIENEPCGSHEAVSNKDRVPKQHSDDDDYEDGEFRESLLRDAFKGDTKEKKDVSIKEVVKSDTPLEMPSPVPQHGTILQTIDESKDVHCTVESEILLCPEKTEDDLNMIEDVKESSAIEKPTTESSKKKAVKISRKMSHDLGKENGVSKPTHKKILSSGHGRSPDKTGTDLGSQQPKAPADQSGPSKTSASQAFDATKQVKDRSDRSHITRLGSPTHASSARIKALHSRPSSRSERERIKEKTVRREKVYMKSAR